MVVVEEEEVEVGKLVRGGEVVCNGRAGGGSSSSNDFAGCLVN